MKNNDIKLDIRPRTNIYSTYQRLSYKQQYALAEFVDNSTASYYENSSKLIDFYKKNNKNYKLIVHIHYDNVDSKNPKISIRDNAGGMDIEEFKNSLELGKPPKHQGGRNEFGMGLKTAATWFSQKWTLSSSKIGTPFSYKAVMDINYLNKTCAETIDIKQEECGTNSHGTKLILENLNKSFSNKIQKRKMVNIITNMYRRDLDSDKIKIIFSESRKDGLFDFEGNEYDKWDDIPSLKFEKVKIRVIKANEIDGIPKDIEACEKIDGSFNFDEKQYNVKGFIAIRERGSRSEAGLVLMRRNRVILGGYEEGYRPKDVFGDSASFPYQRLFGELDLDDFPVNQAKDGFSWENGLEDAFIEFIKNKSANLKMIANKIRNNEKVNIDSLDDNKIIKNNKDITNMINSISDNDESPTLENKIERFENDLQNSSKLDSCINQTICKKQIELIFKVSNKEKPNTWLEIKMNENIEHSYTVLLNIEHKFLKPFSENEMFVLFMRTFSIAYVNSLISLREKSSDNKIDPIYITDEINKMLLIYTEQEYQNE